MQGALRFATASLAIFATFAFFAGCMILGLGCAPTVDLRIDQRRQLDGYRGWNFLAFESGNVRAPEGNSRALDAALTRLVERCLEARGFVRVTGRPDFYVSYYLEIRRQVVNVTETRAAETLQSFNHTPWYEIHANHGHRVEIYEQGQLTIFVSDPDDRAVVWRGGFGGRFRGEMASHLKDAVSSILDQLPASTAAGEAATAEGASARAEPRGDCASRI
jgi:hypothetical protein